MTTPIIRLEKRRVTVCSSPPNMEKFFRVYSPISFSGSRSFPWRNISVTLMPSILSTLKCLIFPASAS